jgi:hypothetical protein
MAKSTPEKTNGHSVDPLKAATPKTAVKPARPAAKAANKPAPKAAAKPAAKPVTKPVTKPAAKPVSKGAVKPAVKTAAKPAAKAPAKPAAKPAAKAASKPESKAKPGAPAVEAGREKVRKAKLVRDSFTMPEPEYAVLSQVKKACLKAGVEIKKSELLRIGVALIAQIDMATLKSVLASLPQLKTGRPKNS